MSNFSIPSLIRFANFLGFLGVATILVMAFVLQITLNELPCPLCLLQRVGFMLIMLGFLMNLTLGLQAKHYAVVILGAMYTGMVGMRQVALHVIPNTGSYGSAVFGMHLYTWSVIASVAIIFSAAVLMMPQRQYAFFKDQRHTFGKIAAAIFFILVVANIASLIMECGFTECPDNPVTYLLFQ